jgi:hypothetical protein
MKKFYNIGPWKGLKRTRICPKFEPMRRTTGCANERERGKGREGGERLA